MVCSATLNGICCKSDQGEKTAPSAKSNLTPKSFLFVSLWTFWDCLWVFLTKNKIQFDTHMKAAILQVASVLESKISLAWAWQELLRLNLQPHFTRGLLNPAEFLTRQSSIRAAGNPEIMRPCCNWTAYDYGIVSSLIWMYCYSNKDSAVGSGRRWAAASDSATGRGQEQLPQDHQLSWRIKTPMCWNTEDQTRATALGKDKRVWLACALRRRASAAQRMGVTGGAVLAQEMFSDGKMWRHAVCHYGGKKQVENINRKRNEQMPCWEETVTSSGYILDFRLLTLPLLNLPKNWMVACGRKPGYLASLLLWWSLMANFHTLDFKPPSPNLAWTHR